MPSKQTTSDSDREKRFYDKAQWKAQRGNRYSAEELEKMRSEVKVKLHRPAPRRSIHL